MHRGTVLLLSASVAVGCAHSSRKLYGPMARYSGADRCWVAQQGPDRWIFTDPLTGCVLRCRSDVVRWSKVNASRSHSENKNAGASGTAVLATLPLAVPAALLFLPTYAVSRALKAPSASSHHAHGDEARNRGELDEAAESYLRAIANGDNSATESLAEVWLEQGKIQDATRARRLLLCFGGSLGDAKWSQIESWLISQGTPVPECEDNSKEPVPISWED